MTLKSILAGIFAVSLLASCGTREVGADLIRSATQAIAPSGAPAPAPRDILTRERIDEAGVPLILVDVPSRSASATMRAAGSNGDFTTWIGADGVGLVTIEPGLLTSTRGYGGDILSSDVSQVTSALLSSAQTTSTRSMRFIDGENRDYSRTYTCEYSDSENAIIEIFDTRQRTRHIVERCRASDHSFENEYWIDSDGLLWRSVQFAGSYIGYLVIERLHN